MEKVNENELQKFKKKNLHQEESQRQDRLKIGAPSSYDHTAKSARSLPVARLGRARYDHGVWSPYPPAAKSFKKATAPSDMILGLNDEKKEKKKGQRRVGVKLFF